MLDWQIREEGDSSLPDGSVDTPPRSRAAFYLVLVILLLAGALAAGLTWQRFREQETLMREELLAQIRLEENARRFGQTSRLNFLIADDVPQAWRSRYASLFRAPDGEPGEPLTVTLESIEMDGARALVRVQMGAQVQERAYELRADGWRRVPLPVPPSEERRLLQDNGIEFYYSDADETFARALSADMPALLQAAQSWFTETPPGLIPALIPNSITIRPQELLPAWLEPTERSNAIALNSPRVVSVPVGWNISGEGAVRYVLANAVWGMVPRAEHDPGALPGGNRFLDAIRATLAARWALPPEEYTQLRARWGARLNEVGWATPFYETGALEVPLVPFTPNERDLRMLAMAEAALERIEGDDAIAQIPILLAQSDNWDEFFSALSGVTTLELEAAVSNQAMPPVSLPLIGAPVLQDDAGQFLELNNQLLVRAEGRELNPVVVEGLDEAQFVLPDGTEMHPACAPLFGALVIEGEWREVGMRLNARRISVAALTPPQTYSSAPPGDTLLYVATDSTPNQGNVGGIAHIAAINANGVATPVLTPANGVHLTVSDASDGTLRNATESVMLQSTVMQGDCTAAWWLRYVPGRGVTGAWLLPQRAAGGTALMHWDETSGQGILVYPDIADTESGLARAPFWWLREGEPRVLSAPDGMIPNSNLYLLSPGAETILLYHSARKVTEGAALTLLDSATLAEREVYYAPSPTQSGTDFAFSPDGRYLYTAWTDQYHRVSGSEATTLLRMEMATGTATELWSPEQGQLYFVTPDAVAPHLYALAGSPLAGLQLLRISEGESATLVEFGEQPGIAALQRCHGGGLMYLTLEFPEEAETRYELAPRVIHFVPPGGRRDSEALRLPLLAAQMPVLCP